MSGFAHAGIDILTNAGQIDYEVFQKNENLSSLVFNNEDGVLIRQAGEGIESLTSIAAGINEVDLLTAEPLSKADGLVNNKNYLASNSYLDNSRVPVIVMFDLKGKSQGMLAANSLSDPFEKAKQSVLSILRARVSSGLQTSSLAEAKDLKIIDAIALEAKESELKEIEKLDVVKKIELDQRVEILLTDSVSLINATQVWRHLVNNANVTGVNVSIAIIDTGVDYTHPDLGGCFGAGCKVAGGYDFINNDANPMDDHGHGTHVAATAASNGSLKGVAPDAKIYAYKVLSSSGSGSFSQVISGVDRSTDPNSDGNYSDHVDILSMSLGGFGNEDSSLSLAIDRAVERGVVAVVAAGNSGTSTNAIGTPGSARRAVTVAASDKSDNIAYFSSRGPTPKNNLKPDLAAPGVNICAAEWDSAWSSRRCSDNQHVSISGTSMATPHVSGLAALIKQAHSSWDPETIKSALITTTKDLGYNIWAQGAGRVQSLKAFNASLATSPASITFGEVSGSNISQIFTITNLRGSSIAMNISTTNITDGTTTYIKGAVNLTSLSLAANSNITLNLSIDTTGVTGNVYGYINISDGENNYRVPFAFIKISKITVTAGHPRSISPSLFALHNSDLSVRKSAYLWWDYTGRNYTFSVPSGNYTVYAIGDAYNRSLNYILVGNVSVSGGTSSIVLNTSDASIFTVKAEQTNGSSLELYKWSYGVGRRSPIMYSVSSTYIGSFGFTGNRTVYISNTSAFDPAMNFSISYFGYPFRPKLSADSSYLWSDETFTASDELYFAGWAFNNVSSSTAKTLSYSQDDFTQFNFTYNYPGYDPSEDANFQSYSSINFWISPTIWFDVSPWIYQAAPLKRRISILNVTAFGFWHYMYINYLRNSTLGGDWISEFAAVAGQTEQDSSVAFTWPYGSRSTQSRDIYFGTAYTPGYFDNTNASINIAGYILNGYTNETHLEKSGSVYWYSSSGGSGVVNLPRPNITVQRNGAQFYTSVSPSLWWSRNSISASSGAYVVNITLPTGYPLYNKTIITANFSLPSTDPSPPRLNSFTMSPRFHINTTERIAFNISDSSIKNVSAYYSYDRTTWLELGISNSSTSYNGTISITNSSAREINIKITSFDNAGNGITYQINTPSMIAVTPAINLSASATYANRNSTIYFSGIANAVKSIAQLRLEHYIDNVFYIYDRTGYGDNRNTYLLGKYNFFWQVPSGQSTTPVSIKVGFNGTGVYSPVNASLNITINIPQTGIPQYSNIVISPSTHDANDNITINSTWAISGSTIDKVLFESNHTGALTNYSTTNVSTVYNYTISTSLNAGTVISYRFIANSTQGTRNLTSVQTLTISPIGTNISAGQSYSAVNPNQNNTLWCDYTEISAGDIANATVYAEIDSTNRSMAYSNNRYEYNYSSSATGSKTWACLANRTNFASKRLQSSFAVSETNAPTFSNLTARPENKYRDSNITLNATWSDDSGLGHIIFSSNYTGSWRNYTAAVNPSQPYVASYNITNLTNSHDIGWKYFANDTSGNMNSQMPIQSFTVQNRVPSAALDFNDNNKGWGERWNVRVNVSDSDADTLNITLYAMPSGSQWILKNSTASLGGTISLNFSMNSSFYNESQLMINVSDGFSVNSVFANMTVDKDDVNVTVVSGHNNSVLRYGANTIVLGIRIYDADAGEYIGNMESKILWTKDGSISYDDRNCVSSNGYCNITLDPDTSFTVSYQNFTGGTLSNSSLYKEVNATPELFSVNGSLFTSMNGPFGVRNRTETFYLNTTVTDDISNTITADEVFLEYKHSQENSWKSCTPVIDESGGLYTCALNAINLSLGVYDIRYSASKVNYTSANITVPHQFIIANTAGLRIWANFTANSTREILARTESFNATLQFVLRKNLTNAEVNISFNSTNPASKNLSVTEIGRYMSVDASSELVSNLSYAIIKLNYTDEEVNQSGVLEESLRLYHFNGTNWTAMDPPLGGVNTTENYVWGNITSFSDFGIGGKKGNNVSCTASDECNSGNCAADYDGSGAWCAPSGYCSHDYSISYAAGSALCDVSVLHTCSSGAWANQSCSNGCSSGACIAVSSPSALSGGSGYSPASAVTVIIIENATKTKPLKAMQATKYQKDNLDSVLKSIRDIIKDAVQIDDQAFEEYKTTTSQVLDKISITREMSSAEGTLKVSIRYRGNKTVFNFFVYDTVPKAIANSSKLITVDTEQHSAVKVIEEDPVYLFYYDRLYPEEDVKITYKIKNKINQSLVDSIPTPILIAGYYEKEPLPVVQDNTGKKNITIPVEPVQEQKEDISFEYRIMLLGVSLAIVAAGFYLKFRKNSDKKKVRVSRKPVQGWLKKALMPG